MTTCENVHKYENLCDGLKEIESCLHENLLEHLNAEIVLGTIKDIQSAISWLKSTFLFIRVQSNPSQYKLCTGKDQGIEKQLEDTDSLIFRFTFT